MKKNIAFVLLMSLIIASFSVGFSVEMVTPKLNPPMQLPEFPIIDGSSSTVAMHAAIKAYLTDEYFLPGHSKTYTALWRLAPKRENIVIIDGKTYQRLDEKPAILNIDPEMAFQPTMPVIELPNGSWGQEIPTATFSNQYPIPTDMLLSVKYYDSALEEVEKFGADLVITPVAKEGFVFIVHEDNPIESLTQEQIKGIFSGKIKNWKEVGGDDGPIITYQRNSDSGSQTAMVDFMDGVSLVATPYYNPILVSSMSGMITDIRNNKNSIGYNIYSWSLREALGLTMTEESPLFRELFSKAVENQQTRIKFIAVDGVLPSDETLADDTYPLRVYTYSYYNKDNKKGKTMTDWLLTEEGQKVIASGGYVGIFGEMPAPEQIDFNRDNMNAKREIIEFYKDKGYNEINCVRQFDTAKIAELSGEKAKDVTFCYTVACIKRVKHEFLQIYDRKYTYRFIILTREKGATAFEVINEGDSKNIQPFSIITLYQEAIFSYDYPTT